MNQNFITLNVAIIIKSYRYFKYSLATKDYVI